ncbi:MAG: hypothetical protein K8J08_06290, partial [Thermoanaerobaculia bacterium]|nr:hypothetical protein [Thermoanaerobaculia bacterium]
MIPSPADPTTFPSLHLLWRLLPLVGLLVVPARADDLHVDGTCTLGDAIEAANTDETTVGGCVDASPGSDTIYLDVDVVLAAADTARSSNFQGAHAGLPDVTSTIFVLPGLGDTIERDASFDCTVADGPNEFRLLQVLASGTLSLEGITLSNGCADRGGAVAVGDGATLWVDVSSFLGNTARATSVDAQGGAIWSAGTASMFISGSLFHDNLASGPYAEGGALWDAGALATLSTSRFLDNEVRSTEFYANGGAAVLDGSPSLSQLVFQQNVARGASRLGASGGSASAGALLMIGNGATIHDTLFSANLSRGGDSDLRGGDAEGGALETDGTSVGTVLERVTFLGNRAEGGTSGTLPGGGARGGAVYVYNLVSMDAVTLSENVAAGGGSLADIGGDASAGAVFVNTADVPMVVERSTFFGNQAIAGSGGAGDGIARGGGLLVEEPTTVAGSLFEGNTTTVGATTSASPCFDDGSPGFTSLGYNTVAEASPDCTFDGPADQTEVAPSLLPLGPHGCTDALPGGACLPTHPVGLVGPAIDQGNCTMGKPSGDARGFSRPIDLTPANADDGCDAGAYESRDDDVDDVEDGVDNCPGDANPVQGDVDADGIGDVCDLCEGDNATGDGDGDGICFDRDCDD